ASLRRLLQSLRVARPQSVPPAREHQGASSRPAAAVRMTLRDVARMAVGRTVLVPRFASALALRRIDTVVFPNDVAFPYGHLLGVAKRLGGRTVLLQEGARFPLPVERGAAYGSGGCDDIAAWGAAAAEHFAHVGRTARVTATGSPRHD